MGILEQVFGAGMPFLTPYQLGLGKRGWNLELETSSAVVEFPTPYHLYIAYIILQEQKRLKK